MEAEPWMRNTWTELDPLRRGVVHALELCEEDAARWASELQDDEMFAIPLGLPAVGFHLRHLARSLDRLLSYAENLALSQEQLALLRTEMDRGTAGEVWAEFDQGMQRAKERVLAFPAEDYNKPRVIGRDRLPTTVGALLVHCAEHSQRHAGQMVTTAKVLSAMRGRPQPTR